MMIHKHLVYDFEQWPWSSYGCFHNFTYHLRTNPLLTKRKTRIAVWCKPSREARDDGAELDPIRCLGQAHLVSPVWRVMTKPRESLRDVFKAHGVIGFHLAGGSASALERSNSDQSDALSVSVSRVCLFFRTRARCTPPPSPSPPGGDHKARIVKSTLVGIGVGKTIFGP